MIVRMLALVAALALTAQTPPPSISGAVYRGGAGTTSTALVGALVYIHPADAPDGQWTGPAVTDSYGRFLFQAVPPAKYLLRVFFNRKRVWEQVVDRPGRLSPIVLPSSG
ncbi:MAG: hypothetical protein QOJ39_1675 [Candidatus Eremiobacteraeota bacterium]|jgi:hypothetical protein|nr:hypothetical protein [Candidatus Eremiobacteraeota bacterium]